jgi:hypothetical protein
VRQLVHHAPEYWEAFRHKPYGERLRTVSRLTTHVVLMVGSGGAGAGTGAAKAGRLGQLAFPLFSLTREGALAMRLVGYFKGADRLAKQAERQVRLANGVPIRWHVAEPRMVDILKNLFKSENITGIDVV